jgi:hypothetical protein
MRHGRKDPWDKPWVAYAAIGGIVVVVILALVYFVGGLGHAGVPSAPGQSSPVQGTVTARPAGTATTTASKGSSIVIPTATPVSVPAQGVYVKVSYLGGFSGSYGIAGALVKVQDSGDRLYTVDNATGTVTASFRKLDSSSKHDLSVEIWKDGKAVKIGSNSSSYGDVTISYQL